MIPEKYCFTIPYYHHHHCAVDMTLYTGDSDYIIHKVTDIPASPDNSGDPNCS